MQEKVTSDLIEYVRIYGNLSLAECPFTTEDALALSEFCYLKFESIVGGLDKEPMTLLDVNRHPNRADLFMDKRYVRDNSALYEAILESDRFRDMTVGYHVNEIDYDKGTQFSAITFFLPDGRAAVTFRGTDETMVGWQEDFEMVLKKPIYGQQLAVQYLADVAKRTTGRMIVLGHSKGGNLSVYSTMKCEDDVLNRIDQIYNFDGPGFRPEVLVENNYERIKPKVLKFIPKSSPVGLLLDTPGEAVIIEAKTMGATQHNPYNWIIKEGKLQKTTLTEQHELMMQTFNEWMLSLDDERLPQFVSTLCWLLDATAAETTIEFQDDVAAHARALFKAGQEVDDEMKEKTQELIRSYFDLASGMVREDFKERTDALLSELKSKVDEMKAQSQAVVDGMMVASIEKKEKKLAQKAAVLEKKKQKLEEQKRKIKK